jgi:hypothetical protein
MNAVLKDELLNEFERLSLADQLRLVNYAKSMHLKGISGARLVQLARENPISKEDAALMLKAIEEDCERIDLNEW